MPPSKVGPDGLQVLKALAELGALRDFVGTTSGELAALLGVSQQTASRKVLDLAEAGLLARRMADRRQLLKVTPEGEAALREEAASYGNLFRGAGPTVTLRGKVSTGMGEGGWYISRPGYTVHFERLLGFTPFPGTLNVTLEGAEADKLAELRAREGLLVPEFTNDGRTFGAVKCWKAKLTPTKTTSHSIDAGIVIPLRGHHERVLEAVAPMQLRDKLRLQDGDEVAVEVQL